MRELIYRKDRILELCTNKNVLHLGFIQHSHLYEKLIEDGTWLHEKINAVASRLVGIDYLENDTNKIRQKYDYEVYCCDVTQLDKLGLAEEFDVIICGELIEHLENPGLMLDTLKSYMRKDTLFIITTPNPWSKARLNLIKKGILEDTWLNKEHTCWYSFETLKQLLERKGFKEIKYDYYFGQTILDRKQRKGLLKKVQQVKWKIIEQFGSIKKYQYDGLFFIAGLDSENIN